jgi:NADH dehydrogenase
MKIVIIGGGFAGRAAAKTLGKLAKKIKECEIILIDRNDYTTMLPSLPDVAGGQIAPEMLQEKITKLIPESVSFVQDTIQKIDFNKKSIECSGRIIKYDYMIFSPGSSTNYYGFSQNLDKIYTLEKLDDSLRIYNEFKKILESGKKVNPVISGAGFTGLELASNLYRLAQTYNITVKITLVEKFDRILRNVSESMVCSVATEAEKLGIDIYKNETVSAFDGSTVTLSSGKVINDAFFCWCSGVRMGVPVDGNHQKHFDERIIVAPTLQIPEHPEVFVAGDAAAFKSGACFIRQALNFAETQGAHAGKNLCSYIYKKRLKPFKPFDMGWVIPFNLTSIGEVFGVPLGGRLGIFFHYSICGIKNYNVINLVRYFLSAFRLTLHKKNYPRK